MRLATTTQIRSSTGSAQPSAPPDLSAENQTCDEDATRDADIVRTKLEAAQLSQDGIQHEGTRSGSTMAQVASYPEYRTKSVIPHAHVKTAST
nr:hypothetical protein GCM10020092_031550 [Actinoplanes digitatis]